MSTDAHMRIASLRRKIFWRDVLSLLICFLPVIVFGAYFFLLLESAGPSIIFTVGFAFVAFYCWYVGNGRNAANFLFGDEFRIQSEHFIEIENAAIRAMERKKRKEREAQEAEIIAALEHDMQITGILKDPTKDTPP